MYDLQKGYEVAKELYAQYGVDVDKAMELCDKTPISIHCWQGDDVVGFEKTGGALTGGIQTTGNYPGKARTPEELRADMDFALGFVPGSTSTPAITSAIHTSTATPWSPSISPPGPTGRWRRATAWISTPPSSPIP